MKDVALTVLRKSPYEHFRASFFSGGLGKTWISGEFVGIAEYVFDNATRQSIIKPRICAHQLGR